MHLGLGLYRHMLTAENYAFARQCGATHVVIHLVDYFNTSSPEGARDRDNQPVNTDGGCWGLAGDPQRPWAEEELLRIRDEIEAAGLQLHAIENFDPAHWYDVLLGGPRREEQMAQLQETIRMLGRVGVPVMGYNFSIAGVYGRVEGTYARGGALSVGMEGHVDPRPIPDGIVWNMRLPDDHGAGSSARATCSTDELWERFAWFLDHLLPVAEAAGVRLALHPDDPPVNRIRDTPRLVNHPDLYERVLDLHPSPANALEFCLGTLAEMPEGDVHEATARYAARNRIAYVHFRNIRGRAPHYKEVFLDEGDIDMRRILASLKQHAFDGVLIPDHTPQMSCGAPWHAGMAHALGYMKGLLDQLP